MRHGAVHPASANALSFYSVPLFLFTIPIVSTLIGGALALRFRRFVTLLIAIGAGILLGAAFLDLLPEAINVGAATGLSSTNVLALTLLSFLLFYGIQSALDSFTAKVRERRVGGWMVRRAGAGMLIFHSFRDGMAIGAAYAASHNAGYAVALGIAAHDIGDGMNTVLLTSGCEAPTTSTYLFLVADALAPFLGGVLTAWWVLPAKSSVALLVLAAGFFLEMATGDFLPEIRKWEGPRRFLLPSVLFGAGLIYVANLVLANRF